jgi:hypothetical protein
MGSRIGRPRLLTNVQVLAILEWHLSRKTMIEVAREHNVSVSTIRYVIRRLGQYKQISPDKSFARSPVCSASGTRTPARYLMG